MSTPVQTPRPEQEPSTETSPRTSPPARDRSVVRIGVFLLIIAVLACLPLLNRSVGPLLPGPLDSPASLQLMAIVLLTAALAVTLDVAIGFTGLIPFGHGMYFALGAYLMVMSMRGDISFILSAVIAVSATTVVAIAVNALALRTTALGFSLVILAVAEIVAIGVGRNFFDSGAEIGIRMEFDAIPAPLRGLENTHNKYWVALAVFAVVFALCSWMTRTLNGRVWQAIRENRLRVSVMGYNVYWYKLAATVFAASLASLCGVGYAILMGGADPGITEVMFSLGLVVMVVLGGRGLLWGAALGAVIYTMLNVRLPELSRSEMVAGLPSAIRTPLEQPEFILGLAFVAVILFFPDGLGGGLRNLARRRRKTRPELANSTE